MSYRERVLEVVDGILDFRLYKKMAGVAGLEPATNGFESATLPIELPLYSHYYYSEN